MRTHEYELWQIKKTNGDEYVQVRRDFNYWKILQILTSFKPAELLLGFWLV